MSKAIDYLNNCSIIENDFETVTLNEAIMACLIQELESLKGVIPDGKQKEERIEELEKKLKYIK